MKKNRLVAITVVGTIALTGLTVYAGRVITDKVVCPNCNTEIEVERKATIPTRSREERGWPKTVEELKTEFAAKVASGEMTQEDMDKKISQYEQMQKKMEERKAEQEKKLEEYKAELASKVAIGEITQEQMDKKIEQYGKKAPGRNFGRGQRNFKGINRNMKSNKK